jgi:hypothetical protein
MPKNVVVKTPYPRQRVLQVFAFDPSLNWDLDTAVINNLSLKVPWENVDFGPSGEYLEVVDIDPASNVFYPPVDLDDNFLLAQDGLPPSEGSPQFHQQMVYAVVMKTIENFEYALSRKVLWAPFTDSTGDDKFVKRLRIYPHALREPNAYYSPSKKALLFGYFPASTKNPGRNLPGGTVFTCLSHDIVAHETTHALLDGLHPYFGEPSNLDVLALHEAFADIVALLQHFSHPEVLVHQISKTRGDLGSDNLLGQLARQFGEATGKRGALRDAINQDPAAHPLASTTEPHDRGSILVAGVFDAFLTVYRARVADLLRIATSGTGVLPEGAIHPDLVGRMANEAAAVAQHILTMCIRALDYCPPVDITFGEYLRGLITADYDDNPDDVNGYRLAMIESFRRRGIYPDRVRSLSEESLLWRPPDEDAVLSDFFDFNRLKNIQEYELVQKRNLYRRETIFGTEQAFRKEFHGWLHDDLSLMYVEKLKTIDAIQAVLNQSLNLKLWPDDSQQSIFLNEKTGRPELEINSLRFAYRVDRTGRTRSDLVIEMNQRRRGYFDADRQKAVDTGKQPPMKEDFIFRGGSTMLVDVETGNVRYVISKGVDSNRRLEIQRRYITEPEASLAYTYLGSARLNAFRLGKDRSEPFALLHGSEILEG